LAVSSEPRALCKFLQDQLRARSVLFSETTRHLFYAPPQTTRGTAVSMTLGWHIGNLNGTRFFYELKGADDGRGSLSRLPTRSRIPSRRLQMIVNPRSLLGVAVFLGMAVASHAQTVPCLTDLSSCVKPGDTLFVTESGEPIKGTFTDASTSSLALSVGGQRRDFALVGVTRIERERRQTKKGALLGVLIGAGAGIVGGALGGAYPITASFQRDILVVFGGIGGGMGAATGAAIGARIKRRETLLPVHERP
jgi:hypothetical protein